MENHGVELVVKWSLYVAIYQDNFEVCVAFTVLTYTSFILIAC